MFDHIGLHGPNTLYLFIVFLYQRWSEYNTNVLEYEYDYFEHA